MSNNELFDKWVTSLVRYIRYRCRYQIQRGAAEDRRRTIDRLHRRVPLHGQDIDKP